LDHDDDVPDLRDLCGSADRERGSQQPDQPGEQTRDAAGTLPVPGVAGGDIGLDVPHSGIIYSP
jgi:hypothetical protein